MSFTIFGDPLSAVDTSSLSDWQGVDLLSGENGEYYQPPISMRGLAKLVKASPHHGTLVFFKANMLAKYLNPNRLLSKKAIRKAGIDFGTTGNCYFKRVFNNAGQVIAINNLPAINMRRKPGNLYCYLNKDGSITHFKLGEVVHIMDEDPEQSIYGVPYWYGALQTILLGEDSRLFYRRYFKNGASTGLAIATSGLKEASVSVLQAAIKGIKGLGIWKAMHLDFPAGKIEDMIKVLPFTNDGAKIDYAKFMAISKDEICAAWRIRPEIAGMMPENTGGSGDLLKIMQLFHEFELMPFQDVIMELNDYLPLDAQIAFDNPYKDINPAV